VVFYLTPLTFLPYLAFVKIGVKGQAGKQAAGHLAVYLGSIQILFILKAESNFTSVSNHRKWLFLSYSSLLSFY
jgi:hypothetical protein